jgi:hypothetical protein
MLIFGEAHLRRVLSAYSAYYNQARTHLALQKDAPLKRSIERFGRIAAIPSWLDCTTNTSGYDFRKGQCQPDLGTQCRLSGPKPTSPIRSARAALDGILLLAGFDPVLLMFAQAGRHRARIQTGCHSRS